MPLLMFLVSRCWENSKYKSTERSFRIEQFVCQDIIKLSCWAILKIVDFLFSLSQYFISVSWYSGAVSSQQIFHCIKVFQFFFLASVFSRKQFSLKKLFFFPPLIVKWKVKFLSRRLRLLNSIYIRFRATAFNRTFERQQTEHSKPSNTSWACSKHNPQREQKRKKDTRQKANRTAGSEGGKTENQKWYHHFEKRQFKSSFVCVSFKRDKWTQKFIVSSSKTLNSVFVCVCMLNAKLYGIVNNSIYDTYIFI